MSGEAAVPAPGAAGLTEKPPPPGPRDWHPSGKESYGKSMQILRALVFIGYFTTCIMVTFITQVVGLPLYFINREWYYAYMAMTKRYFALITSFMTNIWGPTTVRISGDESVAGQIRATDDGFVEFDFPERIVLVANHQIYTDWLYLWWVGYANRPALHGHIYIILKESLKYIPMIGWGMILYSFIFMSRKMANDQDRMAYRLRKLRQAKTAPDGSKYLDPMWLMLFPEGTNLCANGRKKSAAWAKKNDLKDPEHVMLPRSTGMFFCLNELKGTVDYVYDCTVAYEGIPRGKYGEEFFGLSSTYFQGRPPKSVNLYWRRFRVSDIPLDDPKAFGDWLLAEWYKKDALLEQYQQTERFPPMVGAKADYVVTSVRLRSWWEIMQIFSIVGLLGLIWRNVVQAYALAQSWLGL